MKRSGVISVVIIILALPLMGQESPLTEIEKKVDSLFIIASSGEIKYRDMVVPAIDSLVAMGSQAVPRLVEKYDTKVARERRTIEQIIEKIGRPAVPHLVESLDDPNPEKVSRICYTLGDIGDSSAVPGLLEAAVNPDWRIRSNVARALGIICDRRGNSTVMNLLADTVDIVRKSAAVAAGQLLDESACPVLVHMLGDEFYGARMMASEALVKFGEKVIDVMIDSLDSDNELIGNLGCTTLGMLGGDSAAAVIAAQLNSTSPVRRALAAEALLHANSSMACGSAEIAREFEKDSTVLYFLDKVLEKYASR